MPSIHALPAEVANKIAAGEVVERPASVVKELVENAIDAGATQITVDIEDGGKSLIRVTDNGHGIDPEDASLLFTAHATSKLKGVGDLFKIRTLGFRGEALASVGSIARVRLLSRRRPDVSGFEITCEGGLKESPRPAASPEGTVIEVRQLFYNVPARRKFLKSSIVESDHIRESIRRIALAFPSIGFRFTRDGEGDLALPITGDLKERASGIAQDWIEVQASKGELVLRGLIAPPRHSRTTSAGEYGFINGRFVRDRILLRAVQDAYREFLVSGRYPIVVLFLSLPPEKVDVNVHPSKAEVRFADSNAVFELVRHTIHHALSGSSLEPSLKVEDLAPRVEERIVSFFTQPAATVEVAPSIPRLQTEQRYFQLHQKYLIQEVQDGILVIDQHALHERCLLEKLRASYRSADMARQKLLLPAVVELTETELNVLEQHRRMLESVGIEFEEFGRNAVRVHSMPALISQESPETLVRDFLDLSQEREDILAIEQVLEMMACRSAIKFGRSLPPEEIEALLADRETLINPHSCAHGRPVAIKLTLDELEKFFRRK